MINNVQKHGGERTLINFEEKFRNLRDPSKQRAAIINHFKYQKFLLKSMCDSKSKSQQSAQGKAFALQELKGNLQFIILLNSQDDQQQFMEDSKRQPAEIQERLKIAKESIKCKLEKFNLRKKYSKKKVNKNKTTILCLVPEDSVNKNADHIFDVTEEDGKVTQITYSGFITRIVKKNIKIQCKLHLKLFMIQFIIMMMIVTMSKDLMKKIIMSVLYCKIIMKEIY